jgi:hypothetical protein
MPSAWPNIPHPLFSHPVPSMEDFVNALAYEVKQEIATRYFGFRTRLETASREYQTKYQEAVREYGARLRPDLCRMQFLLQEPRLFCSFLQLIGLPRDFALGLTGPPSPLGRQELFTGLRGEGFTRWQRFRDLATTIYLSLAASIAACQECFLLLNEEREEICRQLDTFQRQNDLCEILSFLRSLDSGESEQLKFLHFDINAQPGTNLNQELRLVSPAPIDPAMLSLPLAPPLKQIKKQFTEILKEAFSRHHCPGEGLIY